ncbi:MAG: heavy-metal-associated domain-containing protein [Planctomycetota bacterium]
MLKNVAGLALLLIAIAIFPALALAQDAPAPAANPEKPAADGKCDAGCEGCAGGCCGGGCCEGEADAKAKTDAAAAGCAGGNCCEGKVKAKAEAGCGSCGGGSCAAGSCGGGSCGGDCASACNGCCGGGSCDNCHRIVVRVKNLHCVNCAMAAMEAVNSVKGVKCASLDRKAGVMVITPDAGEACSADAVCASLTKAGYPASQLVLTVRLYQVEGPTCSVDADRVTAAIGKVEGVHHMLVDHGVAVVFFEVGNIHDDAILAGLKGMSTETEEWGGELMTETLVLDVEGMTCEGCEAKVSEQLSKLPEVIECAASSALKKVILKIAAGSTGVKARATKLIKEAGFNPTSTN